jgi:hypothetical protein
MSILVRSAFSCFFSFLFVPFSPVFCKDLNVLIRLLYSAYAAEQGSAMCMVPSINLSESDRAVFIDAHTYAELATQKISAGLSDDVVRFVKKSAADLARACTHKSRFVSELDPCLLSGVLQTQTGHRLRSEKCHDQTLGGYLTARTGGGIHDPSRIEGAFSFGQ